MHILNSKFKLLIISLSFIFLSNGAMADEWNSQYGEWTCNGKTGIMPNIYNPDDETLASNMNISNSEYEALCTFTYPFIAGSDNYAFSIAFPSCKFDNDNIMMSIALTANSTPINSANYQISFPNAAQAGSYLTGDEINRDQNAKAAFFTGIISNSSINLVSSNLGNVSISLDGLHQGIQTPYCNKK